MSTKYVLDKKKQYLMRMKINDSAVLHKCPLLFNM